MGFLSDVKGTLPTVTQTRRLVETFGYPGGSYASISGGFGSSITLGSGEEWVGNLSSMTSTYPHWWEIGMNFLNSNVAAGPDPFVGDGFMSVTWRVEVNEEVVLSGDVAGAVEHLWVPSEAIATVVVSGTEMPEADYAEFRLSGYVMKVRV